MRKGAPLLELNNLTTGYGPAEVLFDIDLEIFPQELVAVLGSNGAGKTTLLGAISGLLDVRKGSLFYEGKLITQTRIEDRVRAGITLVPEGRLLFSGLTVAENLQLGAYSIESQRRKQLMSSVYEIFPDLADRRSQLAGTLSGGQQQMVAIGRGLMADPKLLLIDEFSWGLAPALVEDILEALAHLHKSTGLTILIVEQDIRVGLYLADRGYVLENGRVALVDESKRLLANPRVREAYLGI